MLRSVVALALVPPPTRALSGVTSDGPTSYERRHARSSDQNAACSQRVVRVASTSKFRQYLRQISSGLTGGRHTINFRKLRHTLSSSMYTSFAQWTTGNLKSVARHLRTLEFTLLAPDQETTGRTSCEAQISLILGQFPLSWSLSTRDLHISPTPLTTAPSSWLALRSRAPRNLATMFASLMSRLVFH